MAVAALAFTNTFFWHSAAAATTTTDPLVEKFAAPPSETKPSVYWYWISDQISREGLTKDLEAMAAVGIGEAFVGNVDVNTKNRGPIKVLTPEWWDMVTHAIHEGNRVGVKVGFFNSPGWSQSGGPWVKPEQSMRYLAHTETRVTGPAKFSAKLPAPTPPAGGAVEYAAYFQDVAVLAFRAPAGDSDTIAKHAPRVTTSGNSSSAATPALALADGRFDTAWTWPAFPAAATDSTNLAAPQTATIDIETDAPFTARSLTIHLNGKPLSLAMELQAFDEKTKTFRTIATFPCERRNPVVYVGPVPFAPVTISFPAVTARHFRLTGAAKRLHGELADIRPEIAEIELSAAARLDRAVEKQLAKTFEGSHPNWGSYLWPAQPETDLPASIIPTSASAGPDVKNLSAQLAPDGTLTWDVPPGDWIILRAGMLPTGVKNAPASPEGTGLEIDKMNRAAIAPHFDAFVGEILRRTPAADRPAFQRMIADSYEMGPNNWTDGFAADFERRYGYDPLPWLPVFTGRIVGSADESNRFLWDLRRLIADRIASDYVGGLADIAKKHGLTLWLENYGHWGFPAEFLQYGGASNEVGGEFWTITTEQRIEVRDAASAAHIYEKPRTSVEAFTAGTNLWAETPWSLKRLGDWANTEGVNHFVLHVNIHQPDDRAVPGVSAWFGTEFNRHNTWFADSAAWITTIRRQHALLQHGRNVADVAYFIGEDTPKMSGNCTPALPPGYAYDHINADVIMHRLRVENGRFVLPGGVSYRLLVLPPIDTMRPELLKKISALVRDGGTIFGAPPARSPSRENFPACDTEVQKLAAALWENCDGRAVTETTFGKGRVFHNARATTLKPVLDALRIAPDIAKLPAARPAALAALHAAANDVPWEKRVTTGVGDEILWLHRTSAEGEIYFLSNQRDEPLALTPAFRVSAELRPELWDAVTGERRALPEFAAREGATHVPLEFAPRESYFVIFRKTTSASTSASAITDAADEPAKNFPKLTPLLTLDGPWQVAFDPKWGGPEKTIFPALTDWTDNAELGIKYYSGAARYEKTFTLDSAALALAPTQRLLLDLGEVRGGLARVRLNGRDLGVVWCAPWRVDITAAARAGENTLEIIFTNTWRNRLVGDTALPPEKRLTRTTETSITAGSPLAPSGLLGPVRIQAQ